MNEQIFEGLRATPIRRLSEHVGETVLVQGWLYNMRSKGKLHFLMFQYRTRIQATGVVLVLVVFFFSMMVY